MNTAIIIPAYNEKKHIKELIIKTKQINQNIIVVDDGSSDNTAHIAKELGVIVLIHKVNLGKGCALKTGCDYAYKKGYQRMIAMDADGQHDPNDITRFTKALDDYEIIFSYRKPSSNQPAVLKFGNWFINKTLSTLYGIDIKDSQCGYRAFTKEAYSKIRWNAADYFIETEMIIKTKKKKLSYTQLPIETIYADKYKGTTVLDGIKIVISMITRRFFS
jgi:glycosyltransferase involved in cell wall biosynthesis